MAHHAKPLGGKDIAAALADVFQAMHVVSGQLTVTRGKTYLLAASWNSDRFNQTMLNSGVSGGTVLAWWSSTGQQAGVTGYWVQLAVVRANATSLSVESVGNGLYYAQLD